MPFLSIIVPVYGVEKYLANCLDSILAQQFTDYECILVDDGSPDGSGAICDAYRARDDRFIVVHKQNGGVVSARNAGIDMARGTYLGFVDADDAILEEHFQLLTDAARANDADMVLAGYCVEEENGTCTRCPESMPEGTFSGAEMEQTFFPRFFPNGTNQDTAMIPSLWSALFRRELLTAYCERIPDQVRYGEDWALKTLCVLHAGTVVVLKNTCAYLYRQHDASAVHVYQRNLLENERLLQAVLAPELMQAKYRLKESFERFLVDRCLGIVLNECKLQKTTTLRESFRILSAAVDNPMMRAAAKKQRIPKPLRRDRLLLLGIYHGWKCYLCCCCCVLQVGRRLKYRVKGK